jgi:hypothetical protein
VVTRDGGKESAYRYLDLSQITPKRTQRDGAALMKLDLLAVECAVMISGGSVYLGIRRYKNGFIEVGGLCPVVDDQ